jgi:hypothetical protein
MEPTLHTYRQACTQKSQYIPCTTIQETYKSQALDLVIVSKHGAGGREYAWELSIPCFIYLFSLFLKIKKTSTLGIDKAMKDASRLRFE